MNTENVRDWAIIAVIAIAPLAITLIIALLRGYSIDLHLHRDNGKRRWRQRKDDDNDEQS